MLFSEEKYDVLIVGTGVAGLCCALNLPESAKVLMLSKDAADRSDSFLAQGGICVLKSPSVFLKQIRCFKSVNFICTTIARLRSVSPDKSFIFSGPIWYP